MQTQTNNSSNTQQATTQQQLAAVRRAVQQAQAYLTDAAQMLAAANNTNAALLQTQLATALANAQHACSQAGLANNPATATATNNTHPILAALIAQLGGHAFTQGDWLGFAGCESANPHIAYPQQGTPLYSASVPYVLADGNVLVLGVGHADDFGNTMQLTVSNWPDPPVNTRQD